MGSSVGVGSVGELGDYFFSDLAPCSVGVEVPGPRRGGVDFPCESLWEVCINCAVAVPGHGAEFPPCTDERWERRND